MSTETHTQEQIQALADWAERRLKQAREGGKKGGRPKKTSGYRSAKTLKQQLEGLAAVAKPQVVCCEEASKRAGEPSPSLLWIVTTALHFRTFSGQEIADHWLRQCRDERATAQVQAAAPIDEVAGGAPTTDIKTDL